MFLTLADRWHSAQAEAPKQGNPFFGCEDVNELVSIQQCGVLFMEGEGEPREITDLKRGLRTGAEAFDQSGQWLQQAKQSAWSAALPLLLN